MKGFLEREVKLDPGAAFTLPELPGRPLESRVFTSTYYDTPPRSLARGGITLRRRVENGLSRWQLKLPREDGRDELEAPGGPAGPPPELAALLKAHLRHGKLAPVATLRTHRSGVRVADGERSLADVTLDAVDILDNGHAAGNFTELEVELVDGNDDDLDRLARKLRRAGAQRTDGQPKLMRVLDLTADAAPGPEAPMGEQFRFMLDRSLGELEAQDPGVRLGEDPEAVHRYRVATRRARALIRSTSSFLGAALVPLGAELDWLAGLLGPVRDLDVLLARLHEEVATLDVDQRGGESILAMLQEAREEARDALLAGISSPRYTKLLAAFEAALSALPPLEEDDALRSAAATAFKKLRKHADRLGDNPADEALHALRKSGKRARYAAELAGLHGDRRIRRFVTSVQELQDVIGEHQDSVVAEERIRHVARRAASATAGGRLIERERARRRAARKAYPAALAEALDRGRKAFPLILLVRHGSAGDSAAWRGDDRERPLDARGRKQAKGLVKELAQFDPAVVVSSPYLRCLQTVEPLARSLGAPVDLRAELGYECPDQETRALVESLAGITAVVCGHGGLEVVVLGDDAPKFRKGATLVLDDELRLVEALRPPA